MPRRIGIVYIPPGHDEPRLRLWCTICMRHYKQDEDTGRWFCQGCGKTYQEPPGEDKILRVYESDPLIASAGDRTEKPIDFPSNCKVLEDKEINPETGEETELFYD